SLSFMHARPSAQEGLHAIAPLELDVELDEDEDEDDEEEDDPDEDDEEDDDAFAPLELDALEDAEGASLAESPHATPIVPIKIATWWNFIARDFSTAEVVSREKRCVQLFALRCLETSLSVPKRSQNPAENACARHVGVGSERCGVTLSVMEP